MKCASRPKIRDMVFRFLEFRLSQFKNQTMIKHKYTCLQYETICKKYSKISFYKLLILFNDFDSEDTIDPIGKGDLFICLKIECRCNNIKK